MPRCAAPGVFRTGLMSSSTMPAGPTASPSSNPSRARRSLMHRAPSVPCHAGPSGAVPRGTAVSCRAVHGAAWCAALRCCAVPRSAVCCDALPCSADALCCGVLPSVPSAVWCNSVAAGVMQKSAAAGTVLQRPAVPSAVWCSTVPCGVVRCRAMRCHAVRYSAVRCDAVRCRAVRHGAVLHGAVLRVAVLRGAVLRNVAAGAIVWRPAQ